MTANHPALDLDARVQSSARPTAGPCLMWGESKLHSQIQGHLGRLGMGTGTKSQVVPLLFKAAMVFWASVPLSVLQKAASQTIST